MRWAAGLVMAEIDYRNNENHISAELSQLLELGDDAMTVPRQAIFDRMSVEIARGCTEGCRFCQAGMLQGQEYAYIGRTRIKGSYECDNKQWPER